MKLLVLRLGAISLLLALGACMNMSGLGGDSKYACKAPDGVACDSVSGTYANAVHNKLPNQQRRRSAVTQNEEPQGKPSKDAARSAASVATSDAAAPSPLRSQTRVLRLWIKPWEDADGDLYDQGYIYVQVDNGQWLIDHVQRQIRDAYAPLKPPPKPANDSAAEPNPAANTPNSPMLPTLPLRPPLTGFGVTPAP